MTNKQTVKVVAPGDPEYDILKNMANGRAPERFDWEKFSEAYNAAEVGSVIAASLVSRKTQNAHKVLKNRGLTTGVDYTLVFATRDTSDKPLPKANRPALITKLTPSKLKLRDELR